MHPEDALQAPQGFSHRAGQSEFNRNTGGDCVNYCTNVVAGFGTMFKNCGQLNVNLNKFLFVI